MKIDVKKWSEIQEYLPIFKQNELISLIGELYRLNNENKHFINARCSETCEEAIKPYRLLVQKFISPDIRYGNERIEKAKARKSISDYWKATRDDNGKIDLMLHYVECGTQFTLTYGDIDEPFYNSLASMFQQTIVEIKKLPLNKITENFIHRLNDIVHAAKNIGWGYGDEVNELFDEANFLVGNV